MNEEMSFAEEHPVQEQPRVGKIDEDASFAEEIPFDGIPVTKANNPATMSNYDVASFAEEHPAEDPVVLRRTNAPVETEDRVKSTEKQRAVRSGTAYREGGKSARVPRKEKSDMVGRRGHTRKPSKRTVEGEEEQKEDAAVPEENPDRAVSSAAAATMPRYLTDDDESETAPGAVAVPGIRSSTTATLTSETATTQPISSRGTEQDEQAFAAELAEARQNRDEDRHNVASATSVKPLHHQRRRLLLCLGLTVVIAVIIIITVTQLLPDDDPEDGTLAPSLSPTTSAPTQSLQPSMAPTMFWSQLGQDLDGVSETGFAGWAVALSGNGLVVAVGAPALVSEGPDQGLGQVLVFDWLEDQYEWTQKGQILEGQQLRSFFGTSVAISQDGSVLAVGSEYGRNGNGEATVYSFQEELWEIIGEPIIGRFFDDGTGRSVALSAAGTILAVGSDHYDGVAGQQSGVVDVFELQQDAEGSVWVPLGNPIEGVNLEDRFGWGLSLSHDGLIVAGGAYWADSSVGTNNGHVRVFEFLDGDWQQLGSTITGAAVQDELGRSVSLSADGKTVALGSWLNDDAGEDSGHGRVFLFNGTDWVQKGRTIGGESETDQFGWSASISADGNIVAFGSDLNDGINGADSGQVRLFKWVGGDWVQLGDAVDGEGPSDGFGVSVSLSHDGSSFAAGGYFNGDQGFIVGHARVFKSNA